ncbi:MAG: hypothetical protein A2902_00405 [Elusimicrobia bacterium RIFCSPLOWO2_01_FULL_64_13]|nr:MAG: hypothetical protein A2636_01870 [Elusimicrobia bacterium RIFCSPHIGHO2_01_FULL_64_10]OGR94066.1 MAG: hypothetical protein A2902_00405 [Elusimicrobia bacterium RIFCSPLOWO2_01_FULL_64_13]
MKLLFAASECVPFVKTGGLADVAGSLPDRILAHLGGAPKKKKTGRAKERKARPEAPQVLTVLPKYSSTRLTRLSLELLPGRMLIPVGAELEEALVWRLAGKKPAGTRGSHTVYFIDNEKYFDREGLYGTAQGDYPDNDERFIFYSRAALELCKFVDFTPDLIHCHDWQTGFIPAYLKTLYRTDAFFNRTASLFTIHNVAYQGLFPRERFPLTGLDWADFTPDKLEYFNQVCFMKAGLVYADKLSTVSPSYAREIQSGPEFGRGMEGLLKDRSKDLSGILNGLDRAEWDPAHDPRILAGYSLKSKDVFSARQKCKKDLQAAVRLPEDPSVPLIGMVSRLDPQKGFDRVVKVLPQVLNEGNGTQCVILGSGQKDIEDSLRALAVRCPGQVRVETGFQNDLAHKIYAGSDFFFMPSQFEPCGLGQMIAMRYGSVPIVTPTGGLLDTITPWDPKAGTGTGFVALEMTDAAVKTALKAALKTARDPAAMRKLVRNCMSRDFSWDSPAEKYIRLYESTLQKVRG